MPRLNLPDADVKTLIDYLKLQSDSVGKAEKARTQNRSTLSV